MKKYIGLSLLITVAFTLVFQSSCKKKEEVVHPYTIGQSFGGGIIFYIDASWQHGLICASNDQGSTNWGCDPTLIGGTSSAIGTGQTNTNAILDKCSSSNNPARLCEQYSIKIGDVTYDDWFLPSIDELNQIFVQKIIPSSTSVGYWSSTEFDAYSMRSASGPNGLPASTSKQDWASGKVRAIRIF